MAYGLQTNLYSKVDGTNGYIIKIDISAHLPKTIEFVQAGASSNVYLSPREDELTLPELYNLLLEPSDTKLAWSFNGIILSIYFDETTFPNASNDTRFAYSIFRHCMKIESETDLIDVPDDFIDLFKLYVEEGIEQVKGYNTLKMSAAIEKEESKHITTERH